MFWHWDHQTKYILASKNMAPSETDQDMPDQKYSYRKPFLFASNSIRGLELAYQYNLE